MFRHTFATSLLEEDVDIRYIQKFLGHSSITTTQIYTQVTSEKCKDILKTKHPLSKMLNEKRINTQNIKYGLRDEILNSIINIGKSHNINKIVLFGSRARGDYKDRSDIDIAVYGGNIDIFAVDINEDCPTLLKFDVVNMDKPVQKELLDAINREEVVIYEKV